MSVESWATADQNREEARPTEIAPLIVQAYDLSAREQEIAQPVMAGASTSEIAAALHITQNTVQDHLKAIFDKTGVRSRRELVGRVFFQHYLPACDTVRRPVRTVGSRTPAPG